jgi:PAS domain S-box-containing protein
MELWCWHDYFTRSLVNRILIYRTILLNILPEEPNLQRVTEEKNGYAAKATIEPAALLTLIDSIPALVGYIDCNMTVQFCNKPFKDWFGITENDGKSFQLLIGLEIFNQLQRHLGKVLTGERASFQIRTDTQDGLQFLAATLSPDFDQNRKVKGFIFHCSDVTEKNRTERALKDYFENSAIGIHWVNSNGKIIWANPAELNLLGYSEEEYIGQHISKFHSQRPVIDDILARLTNKQSLTNYDADLVCKDGSIRHVTINSTVLWEGEKFVHTRCFTIDVTEKKKAVKAVMESEERFRTMASLAPLIIWTANQKGDFDFLSIKWTEVTGKSYRDGLGNSWQQLIHPEDRDNIKLSWTKCFTVKKSFEAKFRLLNANGEYVASYVNSTPRYDTTGTFAGYIGIIQDIAAEEKIKTSLEKLVLDRTDDLRKKNSDLKLAEKALQRKNEELARINGELESFAHIASHDLQEPLRKILIYSSKLFDLEGEKFSEHGKELFNRIGDSSSRMKNLIQDLLAYSKSNDNEGKYETVDLNVLVKEVMNELEVKIDEKNATIENFVLPTVSVIRFQFHQLFLNLLSNALKFSRVDVDPCIVIKCNCIGAGSVPGVQADNQHKSFYHISVADNGVGFDKEHAEKVFEMFKRLHSRSQYEGTGIGLAICKKIVENHEGIIIADSTIGKGATFHVYLPEIDRNN